MKFRWILLAAVALSFFVGGTALGQDDAGMKAFTDANCNRCHSLETHEIEATITSERMKGPDLSNVGAEHDAEWIADYVTREVQLEGKNHRMEWKGSEKELQTIAEWLSQQKTE